MTSLFIGGCSGSSAPTHPELRHHFGSLTTSLGIIDGKKGVIVDQGTGVRQVAGMLLERGVTEIVILQTHFHLDHCEGIPNNQVLLRKGLVKAIYAPRLGGKAFPEVFNALVGKPLWPVSPSDLGSPQTIREFNPGDSFGALITHNQDVDTLLLNHENGGAGGSVAYRISTYHGDIVIATDNEITADNCEDFADFVSDADILYADVQYRTKEWRGEAGIGGRHAFPRMGWGHSTPETLHAAISHCAHPPKLVLCGHHDPDRTDDDICAMGREIKTLFDWKNYEVKMARQGDTFELEPRL